MRGEHIEPPIAVYSSVFNRIHPPPGHVLCNVVEKFAQDPGLNGISILSAFILPVGSLSPETMRTYTISRLKARSRINLSHQTLSRGRKPVTTSPLSGSDAFAYHQ